MNKGSVRYKGSVQLSAATHRNSILHARQRHMRGLNTQTVMLHEGIAVTEHDPMPNGSSLEAPTKAPPPSGFCPYNRYNRLGQARRGHEGGTRLERLLGMSWLCEASLLASGRDMAWASYWRLMWTGLGRPSRRSLAWAGRWRLYLCSGVSRAW